MKRILFTLIIVLGLAFAAWYGLNPMLNQSNQDNKGQQQNSNFAAATLIKPGIPINDFALTDSNEKPFSTASLKGHWTLMFFGYADCPDICPRALTKIAEIYQNLNQQNYKYAPRFIFVSLDPTVDTTPKLREFLGRFNPNFIGLTGNEAEMKKLATSCRVYSYTDPNPNAAGSKNIDHSAMLMLINPKGQLHALFSPPHEPEQIAKDIQALLN